MRKLMQEFIALGEQVERTKLKMRELSFPPTLTKGVAALESKMMQVANASKTAGDEMAAAFVKVDGVASETAANVERIALGLRNVATEVRAVNGSAIPMARGPGRAPGGPG
jgi:outer membrane murein-binding lipoprotein Lpp